MRIFDFYLNTKFLQGYDFLSLGTGLCGLDTGKSAKGAGSFREPPQQFHMPYLQSQNHSSMFCSLPQNGYSSSFHSHNSALAAQQVAGFHFIFFDVLKSHFGIALL